MNQTQVTFQENDIFFSFLIETHLTKTRITFLLKIIQHSYALMISMVEHLQ